MTETRFFKYELLTTDPKRARAFYTEVIGPEFWDSRAVSLAPLPERAAAAGAPPHWLGHIGVEDVDETVHLITAGGGTRLGPASTGAGSSVRTVLRDPFGAVLALSVRRADLPDSPVAWHLHHSQDHQVSFAWYAERFGWGAGELVNFGPDQGSHQMFAWQPSGKTIGSMADTARQPGIHVQWLFFFPVADIDRAGATICSLGGSALEIIETGHRDRVVPGNDPQGAAFALYERKTSP
jgi:uncharacterized protein